MSLDQFRRFRQVGTYGAYRVILRTIPGFTTKGDGWTPAGTATTLAKLVNESLPRDVRLNQTHFENRTKWGRWREGDNQARYWVEHGWPTASAKVGGLLPTPDEAFGEKLPKEERELLEPVLFGAESIRRLTAETLAATKGTLTHAGLCDALANSRALAKGIKGASLEPLPSYSRLADAAMHSMRGLWADLNRDVENQTPSVEKLARSPELRSRLEAAREAAEVWLCAPGRTNFPHDGVITHLAQAMQRSATSIQQLRALAAHHHKYGAGRRWFREQAGRLVPLVADTSIPASDYRFRLRALSLLAAQCGVAKMSSVLEAIGRTDSDDEDGDAQ